MKLNTLLVFTFAVVTLAIAAAGTYTGIIPTEMRQSTVLIADGPGPEQPPPIIIW
jgi:hypothetical protein